MKFIAQGIVLSKVACHIERQKQAERTGVLINDVPLKYGSVRLAVNLINLNNTTSTVTKLSLYPDVKEERLILEISYKFNPDGSIVSQHDIIDQITVGHSLELSMDCAYISKTHYLKLINVGINTTIKSYFIKSWADRIHFLNSPELKPNPHNSITPKLIVQKLCQDSSLIIV